MKKLIIIGVLSYILLVPSNSMFAFDLCPACSPEIVGSETGMTGYMLGKNKFSFIGLYRFGEEPSVEQNHNGNHGDFERALFSFNYGITDKFKAGLMYGFSAGKISLQIDYLLLQEKNIMPSLILGAGSFRGIFSESHPYLIGMKNLEQHIKLPVRVSAGIKHKGDDLSRGQLEPVGNLIFNVYQSIHLMGIFEGQQTDIAMYGVLFNRLIVGMRMIELKSPAIGVVIRL